MNIPLQIISAAVVCAVIMLVWWWDRGKQIRELYAIIETRDEYRAQLQREAEEYRQQIERLHIERLRAL